MLKGIETIAYGIIMAIFIIVIGIIMAISYGNITFPLFGIPVGSFIIIWSLIIQGKRED